MGVCLRRQMSAFSRNADGVGTGCPTQRRFGRAGKLEPAMLTSTSIRQLGGHSSPRGCLVGSTPAVPSESVHERHFSCCAQGPELGRTFIEIDLFLRVRMESFVGRAEVVG